jgi:hypothetical protein
MSGRVVYPVVLKNSVVSTKLKSFRLSLTFPFYKFILYSYGFPGNPL